MEFWGVEVKVGETVKVDPSDFEAYIHLSQAALGEAKKDKGAEPVVLYLKFGDQKFVLGTLSRENFPQISFDLVLEKEFELSHNSKNGSVHFCGYKAEIPDEEGDDFDNLSDSEEEEEDLPLMNKENGKPDTKIELAKAALAKVVATKSDVPKANDTKKQAKVVPPKKDEDEDSGDEDDDESDDEDDELGSADEDLMDADGDGDEESESDEDEETPKKVDQGKKRPNDSATKTPISAKKAKTVTPQKTDAKKGGHTATPHPMKKSGKSPNSDSKSGGLSCKSCSKNFNSESGLQQHNKAKHGGQ